MRREIPLGYLFPSGKHLGACPGDPLLVEGYPERLLDGRYGNEYSLFKDKQVIRLLLEFSCRLAGLLQLSVIRRNELSD